MKIASFFSGAGGLDLGFEQAGFDIVYANEFDKTIWETYEKNHNLIVDKRDIRTVQPEDIPEVDGFIGGPPCQSWSEAGKQKGIKDPRGQLFLDYIRLLKAKRPKFFVCENVPGILFQKNKEALELFCDGFKEAGYSLSITKYNAEDYGDCQDRERVIFFGIRSDLNLDTTLNLIKQNKVTLQEGIGDLKNTAIAAATGNKANVNLNIANHEYFTGDFSSMFMSRNRVRAWNEAGYTVQASGRQCQLHPQAPKMEKIGTDKFRFVPGSEDSYRRLTVRECARLQGFPDNFIFYYDKVDDGYKMVGNAVPVHLSYAIAEAIKKKFNNN